MGNGVILDTNCFSHVFNLRDEKHDDFSDFLNWLCFGTGYLVYGGSKYINELAKSKRYLKIFRILHQFNKAFVYNRSLVDEAMKHISDLVKNQDFDDPHLAAIVVVTKSRVICSVDERSFPYLKRKDIYPADIECPKIYTGNRCASLLSKKYVGGLSRLNKPTSRAMLSHIEKVVHN